LGRLLEEQQDVDGARVAYQRVIESGRAEWANLAALRMAELLEKQGDLDGAVAFYRLVLDSDDADWSPNAAANLGELLLKQRDVDGARACFQRAADSGAAYWAPPAWVRLGELLDKQRDVAGGEDVLPAGHRQRRRVRGDSVGNHRRGPDLWGFCGGRGHAARRGSRAAGSTWAMPTARCAPPLAGQGPPQRRVTTPGMSRTHSTRRSTLSSPSAGPIDHGPRTEHRQSMAAATPGHADVWVSPENH
jgi:hypothetical protein